MPATALKSKWVNGYLVFYGADGAVFAHFGSGAAGVLLHKRIRVATATINAGSELLPALAGFAYRMAEMSMIAYGGAAATCTTVDILGTQSAGSVKLMAGAQASLTENTQVEAGGTGGAILTAGASYKVCDANTAITCGSTTNNLATATGVDFFLTFAIEAA
jgi:hypothetical protein